MSITSDLTRIQNAKTSIISAIQNKGGTVASSAKIDQLASAVSTIPTGSTGVNTSDATAYASDIRQGKTAYARGQKITGTIANYTGSYSVSPTTSSQTLSTQGKYMTANLVIGAAAPSGDTRQVVYKTGSYTGGSNVTITMGIRTRMLYGYAKLNNNNSNIRMFGGHADTEGSNSLSGYHATSTGGISTKTYTTSDTSLTFIPNGTGGTYYLWAIS